MGVSGAGYEGAAQGFKLSHPVFDIFYQILRCFCHPVSVVQLKIIFQYLSLNAMISVGQTKVKSRG